MWNEVFQGFSCVWFFFKQLIKPPRQHKGCHLVGIFLAYHLFFCGNLATYVSICHWGWEEWLTLGGICLKDGLSCVRRKDLLAWSYCNSSASRRPDALLKKSRWTFRLLRTARLIPAAGHACPPLEEEGFLKPEGTLSPGGSSLPIVFFFQPVGLRTPLGPLK